MGCSAPAMANKVNAHTDSRIAKLEGDVLQGLTQINQTLYGDALKEGGLDGIPAPVRFCHWVVPQVTKDGSTAWELAKFAFQLAIAVAGAAAEASINDKKIRMAEAWYSHAEHKWNRFWKNYMPLEKKLIQEVSAVSERSMNCSDDLSRAQTAVSLGSVDGTAYLQHYKKKYRMCMDDAQVNLINHRASMTLIDTANYNLLDDIWYTDYKNDQRWNRRSSVLNLGRNLSSQALKYGDVARSIMEPLGKQIGTAMGELATSFGYFNNRNPTGYPSTALSVEMSPADKALAEIRAGQQAGADYAQYSNWLTHGDFSGTGSGGI